MSNVLAGIGRGQLEVIEDRVNKRREINQFYRNLFDGVKGITFLSEPNKDFFSNFWLATIIIDPEKTGFTNYDLMDAMAKDNIECRPLWKPMHLQPIFEKYPAYNSGVSEHLFNQGICLPSGSNIAEDDLNRIASCLKMILA